MNENDTNRLSRLTAILLQLQSARLTTATGLAEKFGTSVRTIYRDIRALEQAGVPVLTIEGKGYQLMEGYKIPPVMFTESQANALVLAEQLVLKSGDASFVRDYMDAIVKVKTVLRQSEKDKVNLLSDRTRFDQNLNRERRSHHLSGLQFALTHYRVVQMNYVNEQNEATARAVEPFALVSTTDSWLLIAWCRLRGGFRYFRLDRIKQVGILEENFPPHKMTLQEFFDKYP